MFKKMILATVLVAAFSTVYGQTPAIPADITALLQKHTCYTCHTVEKKMVGPAWKEIAKKKYDKKKFVDLVYKPVPANWPGYVAMVGLPQVPKGDIQKIHAWVETLAKK